MWFAFQRSTQEIWVLLAQGPYFENLWLSLLLSAWFSPTKAVLKQLWSSSSKFQGLLCRTQLKTISLQVKSTFLYLNSGLFAFWPQRPSRAISVKLPFTWNPAELSPCTALQAQLAAIGLSALAWDVHVHFFTHLISRKFFFVKSNA